MAARVTTVLNRLEKAYGPVETPEQWPVLDELIATILSQATTNKNSAAAFEELRRRFPTWESVRQAPTKRIADAIRSAGLADQKAPRIKAILEQLFFERGELSLEFLHDTPVETADRFLQSLPGVGPKTSACVLLFACRKPILPVDTHVHRVSQRLELIGPKTTEARAHVELAGLVPASKVLAFHLQLIRLGRRTCTARNPDCEQCVLLDICLTGVKRLNQ